MVVYSDFLLANKRDKLCCFDKPVRKQIVKQMGKTGNLLLTRKSYSLIRI